MLEPTVRHYESCFYCLKNNQIRLFASVARARLTPNLKLKSRLRLGWLTLIGSCALLFFVSRVFGFILRGIARDTLNKEYNNWGQSKIVIYQLSVRTNFRM